MFKKKVDIEKEVDKCTSLEEAIYYLRTCERYGKVTLEEYRKRRLPVELAELVNLVVMVGVSMVLMRCLEEIENKMNEEDKYAKK